MTRLLISTTILSFSLWAAGCKNENKDEHSAHHKAADQNMQMASANIEPTKGNTAKGTVAFHQMGDKVHVVADISGLTPNAKHGFHIHEGTECGEDGMKAGGHYNPEKHDHGLPNAPADKRHAGDFGNLEADGSGKAHFEGTFDNISISGEKNPIVGHCVIVHAKPDDGSQPTGNAGARIGCGIIKAGGKVAATEKHEPIALGYVISRPEVVNTLINPPQRDRFSSSAGVNQVDWFRLPSLSLPQTIAVTETREPEPEFSIARNPSQDLGKSIVLGFRQAGLIPDLSATVLLQRNDPHGTLIGISASGSRLSTKTIDPMK
jgi:superoxide dismutase, Cu-Zn family